MHVSRFAFVLCSTAEEGLEGVGCEFDAGCLMWVARGRGIVMEVKMEEGVLIDVCKCGLATHERWPEFKS